MPYFQIELCLTNQNTKKEIWENLLISLSPPPISKVYTLSQFQGGVDHFYCIWPTQLCKKKEAFVAELEQAKDIIGRQMNDPLSVMRNQCLMNSNNAGRGKREGFSMEGGSSLLTQTSKVLRSGLLKLLQWKWFNYSLKVGQNLGFIGVQCIYAVNNAITLGLHQIILQ